MKPENLMILAAAVDRLALIKAQLAELATEEKKLKTLLADSGLKTIEGTMHRAAVSINAGRTVTDWSAIAAKFNPSRQLIAAHTLTGEAFPVVRLSARTMEGK
jgi:hypothetical protein